MENKSKHDEIIELVNKLFVYTDYQQWDKLIKEVFTEDVLFDMSSMGAGDPKRLKAMAICQMWAEGFKGIDHVHHQSGNFIVKFKEGIAAEIFCYAIAVHFKKSATKGNSREFVGSYDLHASFTDIGWRLDSFKYN